MNDHLKRFIGSYVTAQVSFTVGGNRYIEYVQGILKDVNENYTVEQYLSFSDLVNGKKDLEKRIRILSPSNTNISVIP